MKTLFIANGISGDNPGLTGGETRFIEIAKAWANAGHEIHLMSSPGGKSLCERMGLKVILHKFVDYKMSGRLPFILKTIRSIFTLPESLSGYNDGVVYSTNEMLLDIFPALRLKIKYGNRIRWVVIVHWLPPFPPWKRKESKVLNSTLFFINERLSVWLANWFADVLLPVSPMTKEQLRAAGVNMDKVHAVECGVDFAGIRDIVRNVPAKTYDAVYMKRLQAVKGVFDLIDIWEGVVKVKPEAKLVVMGEGVDGDKARQIVKERGLEANIEFVGMVYDFAEKFSRISQAKLFILPTYEENWAIVVGEAMAAGTPVVAYDLKEMVDVWGEAAFWVPTGDKGAFVGKVISLLDNPDALKKLSSAAVEYVRRYDWKDIAKRELEYITGNK